MAEGSKSCSLVNYVEGTLYAEFSQNRQEMFEIIWTECRDAFLKLRNTKWKKGEAEEWRSKTYIGVVRQKVISAFALIVDQVLQDGNFPYTLTPNTWMQSILAEMDPADEEAAKKAIDQFKDLIDMQLRDCNADEQLRNIIYSMAIYGLGFAKRTTMTKVNRYYAPPAAPVVDQAGIQAGVVAPTLQGNVFELVISAKKQPAIEHVNVWNMFWDVENPIGKGAGEIERQMVSADWLHEQKNKEFFIESEILEVVRSSSVEKKPTAGESQSVPGNMNPAIKHIPKRFNNIDYKECYVRVPLNIVEEFEKEYGFEQEALAEVGGLGVAKSDTYMGDIQKVDILLCIANGRPVRYTRIEATDRPYFKVEWQSDVGEIAPYGVAESCLDVEKMMNGSVRGMEDNTKFAGDVIFGLKADAVDNIEAIKKHGFKPGMTIMLNERAKTVSDALSQFSISNVGAAYGQIIELATRLSDEESMIPKVSQGLAVASKQTAYEISQMVEKSGKYIGSVIKNIDTLIEEIIMFMYDYNMMDPEIDIQKGDYKVSAEGFTSFQDRVVRVQKMKEFLSMIMQNEILLADWKVNEIMTQIAKGLDLDPELIEKSEADKARDAAAAQAQGPDPVVQSTIEMNAAKAQKDMADAEKTKVETDILERNMKISEAKAVKELQEPEEVEESGSDPAEVMTEAQKNQIAEEKNLLKAKELDDKVLMQEMQLEHDSKMKAVDMKSAETEDEDEMQAEPAGES